MIQDKIINAVSSIGSAGQALTMAAARQEFEAQKKERAKIAEAEKAKEAEYQDIQAGLKDVRSGVLADIEETAPDPEKPGVYQYPERLARDLQRLGTANWTPEKAQTYLNQFADPSRGRAAMKRLNEYTELLQQQRSLFKNDPDFLKNLRERTLENYRLGEVESLINRRGPNRPSGGK